MSETIVSLRRAADHVGVGAAITILGWIKRGKFTPEEAWRDPRTHDWTIDVAALERVAATTIASGRGSMLVKWAKYAETPEGLIAAPIQQVPGHVLATLRDEYRTLHTRLHPLLGESHRRVHRLAAKIAEIDAEFERRGLGDGELLTRQDFRAPS